jgi:hypothetical protein
MEVRNVAKKNAQPTKALLVRFPVELHRKLKGWAGLNGTTIQAVVIEAVTGYLEEKKKRGA